MSTNSPAQRRFISLQWRVLLLLGIGFITIHGSYYYYQRQQLLSQYHAQQANTFERQTQQFEALINQVSHQLMRLSGVFSALGGMNKAIAQSNTSVLDEIFEQHASTLQLDLGIDRIMIFDRHQKLLADWDLSGTSQPIPKAFQWQVKAVLLREKPDLNLICEQSCSQNALLPILYDGETIGTLVLQKSLADAVLALHELTGVDVALLIPSDSEEASNGGWAVQVAAQTGGPLIQEIINTLQKQYGLDGHLEAGVETTSNEHHYHSRIWHFSLSNADDLAGLLLISQTTTNIHTINQSLTDILLFGLLGLIISEFMLVFVLWSPLSRIRHIAKALPLLTDHAYREVRTTVQRHVHSGLFPDEIEHLGDTIISVTQELEALEETVIENNRALVDSRLQLLRRLGRAAEFRDNETGAHIIRMSRISVVLAQAAGLDERECEILLHAAPMHDIGKIGIPDHILLKPGRLTEEEFFDMKRHPIIGADMLNGFEVEPLRTAHAVALTHHEKWNGTGYPLGLKGEDIPLTGRICAVADVFDALTSERPYKEAWPIERAVDLISKERGKHFDPQLVDLFLDNLPNILAIKEKYQD
ncbi:MAG: HD domain-containing protein [Magnetococcales bacterium]|nr:HD domain-containing protein [Magnetococcales bacterium]